MLGSVSDFVNVTRHPEKTFKTDNSFTHYSSINFIYLVPLKKTNNIKRCQKLKY
jgi:hypothetical protein